MRCINLCLVVQRAVFFIDTQRIIEGCFQSEIPDYQISLSFEEAHILIGMPQYGPL